PRRLRWWRPRRLRWWPRRRWSGRPRRRRRFQRRHRPVNPASPHQRRATNRGSQPSGCEPFLVPFPLLQVPLMARITRRQALACGALSLPLLSSGRPADEKELKPVVDDILRAALKSWDVPGVAAGIVRDGKVVYLEGHGLKKLGGKDPITPDTLFA